MAFSSTKRAIVDKKDICGCIYSDYFTKLLYLLRIKKHKPHVFLEHRRD